MRGLFDRLIPFVFLGVGIVALIYGMMLLSYLFLFGAIVGLVLFVMAWLRGLFLTRRSLNKRQSPPSGRIIDSDDWKVH